MGSGVMRSRVGGVLLDELKRALDRRVQPRIYQVVGVNDGDTITARCGAASSYERIKTRSPQLDPRQ